MPEEGIENNKLTTDILKSSLAFQGNSAELYQNAVEEVRRLSTDNRSIYPPKTFPDVRNPIPESSLRTKPSERIMEGALSPAEAVAVKVILDESSALAQSLGIGWERSAKLRKVLKLPKEGWGHDTIEAICDFGGYVCIAAGVRELLLADEKFKEGDIIKKDWHDEFAKPLRKDNLTIGENTSDAIVEYLTSYYEEHIPQNSEGAKNEKEIETRIASRKHGVLLGKKLYLETLKLASNEFSTSVIKDSNS